MVVDPQEDGNKMMDFDEKDKFGAVVTLLLIVSVVVVESAGMIDTKIGF